MAAFGRFCHCAREWLLLVKVLVNVTGWCYSLCRAFLVVVAVCCYVCCEFCVFCCVFSVSLFILIGLRSVELLYNVSVR